MQELTNRGQGEDPLAKFLLSVIVKLPQACLFPSSDSNEGVRCCSTVVLRKILSDPALKTCAAVQILQTWCKEHPEQCSKDISGDADVDAFQALAGALDLAKDLTPQELAHVEPCRLFPMERLYQAMVTQQKALHNDGCGGSDRRRNNPSGYYAIVTGAGVEGANGIYHMGRSLDSCWRTGVYDGKPCEYYLQYNSQQLQLWVEIDGSTDVILYEASVETGRGLQGVPFAFWQNVKGVDPAPLVAVVPDRLGGE